MSYAVLQTDLNPPSLEQLKRAFRAVRFLAEVDAHILGRDAFGILVNNLTPEHAAQLQGALRVEGVATEIVEQSLLPEMPPTKFLSRVDCQPEALMLYDPLGRSFPLEWGHILMIAAGSVRLSEFNRVQKTRNEIRHDWRGSPHVEQVTEVSTREEQNCRLVLEIILTRAVARYSVSSDRFNFAYLGDRRTKSLPENFGMLVRDLMQFAPAAALNRGAHGFRENSGEVFAYPSKNAFFEEIIWLLWRMRTAGG